MLGKKNGQRPRRPVRTAIIAFVGVVAVVLVYGTISDATFKMLYIASAIVGGVLAGALACLAESGGKGNRVASWLGAVILVGEFVVFPTYIWFAGYDCEPPDDSDLAVQEEVNWGPEQEREFAAFTNVLARVEHLVEDDDDIKDEKAVRILASNEWVVATLDRVAESDTFRFPPIEIYQDMNLPVGGICWLYRNGFPARIKVAAENGEFEKMLRFMDRDLRVGEHYLLRGRSFVDHLVGIAICKNTICGLRDLVQRNALPDSVLRRVDERVRSVKGLDGDALFRAYRNEYAYQTCHEMAEWREGFGCSCGLLSCLFVRYLCQPNRTKAYLCAQIRNEMELLRTGHCVKPDDNRTSPWYLMFVDREWIGKDMMSGLRGRGHDLHETIAAGLALRTQIACKRYEMKYGHCPADSAALVPEFLPEVPLSPCDGKAVSLDLAADKIHIGCCDVEELRIGEPKDK